MSALDMSRVVEHGLAVPRLLWQVSWQAALWVLGLWVLTRVLPKLPASVRATLWWLVGLKCLVGLCALGEIHLPLLPAPEPSTVSSEGVLPAPMPLHVDAGTASAGSGRGVPSGLPWALGAVWLWLGGLVWQGRELLRGLRQLRRIRHEARPLEDDALLRAARTLGQAMGLTRLPRLLVSAQAPGPLALGPWRPEIILPRCMLDSMSPLEQRMALAHELAHVRRRDLWLGWVPALAQGLLFFHPLVKQACREYALAREEACDATALQASGATPRDYGRLLLLFGVARAPAATAASGASSHVAALKQRIARLEHVDADPKRLPRWARWVLGALALVALVPFQVTAREAPASPELLPSGVTSRGETRQDGEHALSYVLINPSQHTTISGSNTTISVSRDSRAARVLEGAGQEPLLYVRQNGQEYVIRNEEIVKAIEGSFSRQRELSQKKSALGQEQSALGQKMSALGQKQSEIGQKQSVLGMKIAEMARRRADLAIKYHQLDGTNEKAALDIDRQGRELDHEMESLERRMEELRQQMEAVSKPMEELGQQMEQTSQPMEELNHQLEAAKQEAHAKVMLLLDDAIREGLAEPVTR